MHDDIDDYYDCSRCYIDKRKRRRPTQARSNGNIFNNTTDNYCPLLDISNVHFAFNCSSYRFPSDLHPSVPPNSTLSP